MGAEVAAVVVTYNSAQHVDALLDSLPAAFGDVPYTTVVVDNGSTDDTLALLRRRGDCTVVESVNDGYGAGMNRAVRHSPEAAEILVLNPDVELDAESVPRMLSVLRRPGVGIVAPRTREADGSLSPTLRREPTLARAGGLSFTGLPLLAERIEDPRAYVTEHPVDWAVGAIWLVDRECFDALGGFDETYFLYSEETDFALRARDRGWLSVYAPDAGGMHVGGGSGTSHATHTMQMLNRVRLIRRRRGTPAAWTYYGVTLLVELRRALLGHRASWPTLRALVRPSLRPAALGASDAVLPR
ncbi:glycosyltransferase family 2 protein [Promicromonospora sukumoe]|uniref:GT2 family glycosyltransferase n=1 Tax=Promicromonospora sukumoe TaxID=88382 RepID=A0A7W3PH14_9MICO|nr:glycosyltransferase family 2 protein [Promicromonospora sukumoe]MBA8811558.1 GT2 family glycosyltransferase [Promicromonospora sukumoe]